MTHLHEALQKVKPEGPGICAQVDDHIYHLPYTVKDEVRLELYKLLGGWSEGTGSRAYPVPSPDPGLDRIDAYMVHRSSETLWVGPYGESRKRLLKFLLEQTK